MTVFNKQTLLNECLNVLQYYLNKTDAIIKLHQDTSEIQYFLFALKGTKTSILDEEDIDVNFLSRCINGLIAGQKGRDGNGRLTDLRKELEEELELLKMRFDLK